VLICLLPLFVVVCGKTSCTSSMTGDYTFQACGGFCKEAKKANHCKYCKCKDCGFCKASASTTSTVPAATSAAPPDEVFKVAASSKKKRRPKAPPSTKEAATSPAAKSGGSTERSHKACTSGIKGDYMFETCGAFCKAAKSSNHCKFCKCKQCSFCGGSSSPEVKSTDGEASVATSVPIVSAAASTPVVAVPTAATTMTFPKSSQPRSPTPDVSAAHNFSFGLLIVGLLVVCGLGGCWGLQSGALGGSDGGAIPGFGSERVRAERSQGFERASIMRRAALEDEDDAAPPGLDGAFADVEKLEQSLRGKAQESS